MFIFIVNNATEAGLEYQKKLNELTMSGWDQAKYEKIANWYSDQLKKFQKTSNSVFFFFFSS